MNGIRGRIAHPAVRTGMATAIGYLIAILAITILVFLLPYAIFVSL